MFSKERIAGAHRSFMLKARQNPRLHLQLLAFGFCVIAMQVLIVWTARVWNALPSITLKDLDFPQSVRILDREGNILYHAYDGEDRVSIDAATLPFHVRQAFLAAEDERFYTRGCIDPQALVRAAVANVRAYKSEGASTITQQLARQMYLSPEKTIERKVSEIFLACTLEFKTDKDTILSAYLNRISFGGTIHGIEQAAQTYFAKRAAELTPAEAVFLSAIPQRPTTYSPYRLLGIVRNPEMSNDPLKSIRDRASRILQRMRDLEWLAPQQYQRTLSELNALQVSPPRSAPATAKHFTLLVRSKVITIMDKQEPSWRRKGLTVETTIDPGMQRMAEETVRTLAPDLKARYGAGNIALVAMRPATGEIVAYVGNTDEPETGAIDMAQVPRQPGSSFKPIVYAAALQKGMKPDTILNDSPISIGADRPQNADGGFKGPMFMHHALGASRNIPAIRAFLMAGGEEPVINLAAAMGADAPLTYRTERQEEDPSFHYAWPMAIGAAEVPLVQMTQAYATLANDGVFRPAITIRKITDGKGALAYESPDLWNPKRVLSADIARTLSQILSNPNDRPGGWWRERLGFHPGLAIKTGTSNLCFARDRSGKCVSYGVNNTWAMGFTPDLAIGVWAGNADNGPMIGNADGLNVAVEVFKTFLLKTAEI